MMELGMEISTANDFCCGESSVFDNCNNNSYYFIDDGDGIPVDEYHLQQQFCYANVATTETDYATYHNHNQQFYNILPSVDCPLEPMPSCSSSHQDQQTIFAQQHPQQFTPTASSVTGVYETAMPMQPVMLDNNNVGIAPSSSYSFKFSSSYRQTAMPPAGDEKSLFQQIMSHHRQKQKVRGIGKKNPINISYDNLICPECKTTFNGQYLQQFYTHYEACWTAAVEREHRRLLLESTCLKKRQPEKECEQEEQHQVETIAMAGFRVGKKGEPFHFDGHPTLLTSKSGRSSIFISLESVVRQNEKSFGRLNNDHFGMIEDDEEEINHEEGNELKDLRKESQTSKEIDETDELRIKISNENGHDGRSEQNRHSDKKGKVNVSIFKSIFNDGGKQQPLLTFHIGKKPPEKTQNGTKQQIAMASQPQSNGNDDNNDPADEPQPSTITAVQKEIAEVATEVSRPSSAHILETTGKQHHPQLDDSNPILSSEADLIYVDDDVDELMVDAFPTSTLTSTQFHIQCQLCGLRLLRQNLPVHMRIHTGEFPFLCSLCPKRLRTKSAWKVHFRTHTGERPYECPFCTYSCITKRNLDRHIGNRHHPPY